MYTTTGPESRTVLRSEVLRSTAQAIEIVFRCRRAAHARSNHIGIAPMTNTLQLQHSAGNWVTVLHHHRPTKDADLLCRGLSSTVHEPSIELKAVGFIWRHDGSHRILDLPYFSPLSNANEILSRQQAASVETVMHGQVQSGRHYLMAVCPGFHNRWSCPRQREYPSSCPSIPSAHAHHTNGGLDSSLSGRMQPALEQTLQSKAPAPWSL